jgi:diadenosine tetraphosphate (Ap4A) HIT family hydrolase
MSDCKFCRLAAEADETGHRYGTVAVIPSIPAASPGHRLVIPIEHRETALDLTPREWEDTASAVYIETALEGCDGYNFGFNVGPAGGQTVMHAHFHILPRTLGDCPDPRGGILHALPGNPVLKSSGGDA